MLRLKNVQTFRSLSILGIDRLFSFRSGFFVDTAKSIIAQNLARVQEQLQGAASAAGRDAADVRVVAVTKYAEPAWIEALYELGLRDFGESRPQQLATRVGQFPKDARWHLIGQLQRNKVRSILDKVARIHSVDSLRLLKAIDRIAGEEELRPRVLLQVNVSGEETKQGFPPRAMHDVIAESRQYKNVTVVGLMTMAPYSESPEVARPYFAQLRELRDDLAAFPDLPLPELSMGMSGDLEVAVAQGATWVRPGSALFEGLGDE